MASIFGHELLAYTTSKVITSKSDKLLLLLAIGSGIVLGIYVVAFNLALII